MLIRSGTAGNVVGHEWKSLVESAKTADEQAAPHSSQQGSSTMEGGAHRESPVQGQSAAGGSGGGEEVAPRLHNQDIKIDVLRELEDVAAMTIGETGFFCK